MSRDVLIATVTTIIFVSSIGGALWYGGYTTTLAKLTSLEELLPGSEPKPKPPTTESNNNGDLPPVPPPPAVASENNAKQEESKSLELPTSLSTSPKEAAPADKVVEKSPPPAAGKDDLFGDMDLPAIDSVDSPSKKTPEAKPAEVEAVQAKPAEPKTETAPTKDVASDLGPLPDFDAIAPNSPASDDKPAPIAPPPPPVATNDEPKSPLTEPAIDSTPKPKDELPTVVKERPKEESVLPDVDSIVPMPPVVSQPAEPQAEGPTKQKDEIANTMAPAQSPASPAEPMAMPEPPAVMSITKTEAREPAARSIPTPRAADVDSPIEAKPIVASSVRSPRVMPSESVTTAAATGPQEPLGGNVVARAKPITAGAEADKILSRAEPIARAVAPAASAGAAAAVAGATADRKKPTPTEDEFVPLHQRGNRYAPIGGTEGVAGKAEEFYPVNNLPAGSNLAYGETTVVSRKTGGADVPEVVSYDVSVYRVLDGDTYESIAETMYKTPGLGEPLARFNGSRGMATATVPVGSRVRIPPAEVLGGSRATSGAMSGDRRPTAGLVDSSQEAFKRVDNSAAGQAVNVPNKSAFDPRAMDLPMSSPASPGEYRAEKSETLWAIAAKSLGDGRRWREIYEINKDRLINETQVSPGTLLRLPKAKP
jgi:nucleoid-associated protein YgaU